MFNIYVYYIYDCIMSIITYNDLIKKDINGIKDKSNNYERLDSNIFLNKRENYDDSNKIINSLNEELLSLKRKMKFVYEKDKEIEKLKEKIIELERNNSNSNKTYKTENIALKQINKTLTEKNNEYLKEINQLINIETEGNKKLNMFKKENSLLKRELNIIKKNKETITNIDFDLEVKVKEKVRVDIRKLKNILSKKLENKTENKINELLNYYNIKNNEEIDKDIIEKLLKEII